MTETHPPVLACMRLADVPESPVKATRGHCKRCGMAVWISRSSPRRGKLIWCIHCTLDEVELQRESGEEVTVMPFTAKQIAELKSRGEG